MGKFDFFGGLLNPEESYLQILDALHDFVIVKNPDSKVLWANRAFCEYSGLSNEDFLSMVHSAESHEPKEHSAQYMKDDHYVFSTGKVLNIPQEPIASKTGEVRFYNTVKSPIFDRHGEVKVIVATCRDITDTLQVQKVREKNLQLMLAVENAEKSNKAKSVFLANMSHELRTPMHAILSFAQIGQEHDAEEDVETLKSYFTDIHDSGSRLMGLLNELLDLSALEANKIRYSFEKYPFQFAVSPLVTELTAYANERGVKLQVNSSDQEITAQFDLERMMQVLKNLILNAIKFSNPLSVVEINVVGTDESILCSVTNFGVGIPQEEIHSIFEKFTEGSRTRSRAGGKGLGLAISKEIIAQHDGRIWAESTPNGKTVLCFEFPRQRHA
jgi:PAS domain S-box-containing protein